MPLQQLHAATAVHPLRQRSPGIAGAVVLVQARGLADAEVAISSVRQNNSVVLQCGGLEPPLAQRIIDMVSGGVCAIDGQIRHISPDVVLCLPALANLEQA